MKNKNNGKKEIINPVNENTTNVSSDDITEIGNGEMSKPEPAMNNVDSEKE